jgi:hypothetical protein
VLRKGEEKEGDETGASQGLKGLCWFAESKRDIYKLLGRRGAGWGRHLLREWQNPSQQNMGKWTGVHQTPSSLALLLSCTGSGSHC